MRKIAIYGGVFDPIHLGHIHLACELKEACNVDEVWLIPAYRSPHKQGASASPKDRMEMLRMAIEPFKNFKALPYEIERGGPSYSIETVNEVKKKHNNELNNSECVLFLGEDAICSLSQWYKIYELIETIPIYTGKRFRTVDFPSTGDPKLDASLERGFKDIPLFEVDSTTIKKRLANNLDCSHLLAPKVLDYILQNQLYSLH
jgi:nicotinate-nucleotide adenylyltransferase